MAKASVSLILAILKPSVSLIHGSPSLILVYKNPTLKSKMLVININEHNYIPESLLSKLFNKFY